MSRLTPYDSLNRELRRAETRRRKAQLVGASIGVTFLVGAALIAVVLVLNRTPAESPGSPLASTDESAPVATAEPLSVESSTPPLVPTETAETPAAATAPEVPSEDRKPLSPRPLPTRPRR